MIFTHLSPSKLKKIKTPKVLPFDFKPLGSFWVSCGNDWEEWGAINFPDKYMDKYKYKYEVDVDISNLIVIKTYDDIKVFSDKFGVEIEYGKYTLIAINWESVRKETNTYGIYVVNPNIKSARKKFDWYSSFDICSVAVWDKRAILSYNEIKMD